MILSFSIYTLSSIVILALATGLVFVTGPFGVICSYLGLAVASIALSTAPSLATLIFWGVAAAIVVMLNILLPKNVANSRLGVNWLAVGSVAGMLVGLTMGHAAMVIGAVVGMLFGGVAFAKTPKGSALGFPSSKFFNYLCAKGLPMVVTVSIIGTAVGLLLDSI